MNPILFILLIVTPTELLTTVRTTTAPPDPCSSNPCQNNGTCTANMDGTRYTCNCTGTGYEGDQCADDINECSNSTLNACDSNANCTNINGGYMCMCLDGYMGNGEMCEDINECTNSSLNTCDSNANCTNIDGGYTCKCLDGFAGDGEICQDINECTNSSLNTCDSNANCTNIDGGYTCKCLDRFTGDGEICQDINECSNSSLNVCDSNANCTNIDGGYMCMCLDGYMGDGEMCEDINECNNSTLNTCDSNANCTNIDGGYMCMCLDGYMGDGEMCEDINECTNSSLNTCDSNANCTNIDGGYTCKCLDGFTGDGEICQDINECTNSSLNTCDSNANCTNIDGGYTCKCLDGFTGDGQICQDIDECSDSNLTACDPNANCTNTDGSYYCTCLDGFRGNGETCQDIDECYNSTLNACDPNANCTNTEGSYNCTCRDGFRGNGTDCQDIDECSEDMPCMNGATCRDNDGSYDCDCVPGWEGKNCQTDIDECLNMPCQNGATCNNNDGSYKCDCAPGYDGTNCDNDIDECASSPCQNGGTCQDEIDGFTCMCGGTGYEGDTCETNIDECTTNTHNCDPNASCFDTPGSFYCECNDGYYGNGMMCTICDADKYGSQCTGICTCITGATCNNVDGMCTCDESDLEFECDKDNLQVSIQDPGPVLDGQNVNLTCKVNLPRGEIDNGNVFWVKPDGSSVNGVPQEPDMGLYTLLLTNAQPNVTSGTYRCSATTQLHTGPKAEIDSFDLDVKAPGRIINGDIAVEANLGDTTDLDCTVYGNTNPDIAWYDQNGIGIDGTEDKYDIIEREDLAKLFTTRVLRIFNIVRGDNGSYTCNITNTINVQSDDLRYDSAEYDLLVLERPEITIPTAREVSAFDIEVSWTIPFIGNSDVTSCTIGYQVFPNGKSKEDVIVAPVVTTYNISGLTPYTDYNINVTCTNEVGASETMAVPATTRTRQSNPGKPMGIAAEPEKGSSTIAIVTWLEPVEPNGPIAFYEVELEGLTPIRTVGKVEMLTIPDLTPGESYNVFVRAYNVEEDGIELEGEVSDEVVVLEMPPARPTAPLNAEATEDDKQCTVTWDEPTDPNGVIESYTVYWLIRPRTDLTSSDGEGSTSVTQREYQVLKDHLVEYSRYEFEVSAFTAGAGEGENATVSGYCYTDPGVPDGATAPPPSGPDLNDPKSVTTSTFKMGIQAVSNRYGNVGCYEVVVVGLEKNAELPSGPDMYPPEEVTDWKTCKAKPGCAYTAMVLNESELQQLNGQVIIGNKGDDTTCNDEDVLPPGNSRRRELLQRNVTAYNGQLQSGTSYTAFTRAYIPDGNGQVESVSSPLIDVVRTDPATDNTAAIVAPIIMILLLIVIVLLVF
ncbi:uncharacterized protein [Amphiura filiformis]|uniref:uncharacterized protein n=1 Tax=Amphiura filiformis TaxID=82378 RepID=UPI003B22417F